MFNRAQSARSQLPKGKPTSLSKCSHCQDTGVQENGALLYNEIYGSYPVPFCQCSKGKELFVAWSHEPAQEKKANEMRDKLRLEAYAIAKFPPRFIEKSMETLRDNATLYGILSRYVKDWKSTHEKEGTGLFFWGAPGVGKTHTVIAVCNALIYQHFVRVFYVKSADAINQVKKSFDVKNGKDPVDKMMRAQLLVIDDLGIENATDFFVETLYRIIDYRYEHKLPTIITSNQDLGMISNRYIPQIASRLREMTYIIQFGGKDRRHKLTPQI